MTLFWHNHFATSNRKVNNAGYMLTQYELMRRHAQGNFRTLLQEMSHDPAMMVWLDTIQSQRNQPNENYARELMELFTLGVNGGYSQDDVHNAARALTGFHLTRDGVLSFSAAAHDAGTKTLLGHTGNLDYKDVIRIVAGHPSTGPFLARRIFRFFAYENPSDADIQPMVDAYYSSGHSIKAVMRTLFIAPAFQSPSAYRARLKSPAEFVIGAIRQLELETPGQGINTLLAQMGQNIFAPPNVAGWSGDQTSADWLNTGTWLARINFINGLLNGFRTQGNASAGVQALQTAINQYHLQTPDDLLNHFTTLLLDGNIAADRRQTVRTYLTTSAAGPTVRLASGQTLPMSSVRDMAYLLMSGPEYLLN
jgi:uncharacterized protein (DUF1800 family)